MGQTQPQPGAAVHRWSRPAAAVPFARMPPLITRDEALALGELEDHAAIEELIERAWRVRSERFADSTDLCSLVNAKSGGCAEDCGFCAQSRFAEAETPLHAMMSPEQILDRRALAGAGLNVTSWDPSTQLRHAKQSSVPPRPDGAPNRGPGDRLAERPAA
jgi:hypothetical protein